MQQSVDIVNQQQYLTFALAGEEYAVGILRVKEIIEYDVVTKVPKTPQWVRGVINLRGQVVPVMDLAVKFGLPENPVSKTTCIVILEVDLDGEQTTMGVIADAVNQVIELKPEDIEEAPPFGTQVRVDYLLGMGKADKKFVLILDIDHVLSTNELLSLVTEPAASATPSEPAVVDPAPTESPSEDGATV